METMKLRLVSIESMIDCGNVDQAIDELKTFSVSDDHPYAADVSLLKGKSQVKKRKWERAERELLNAIRIANQNPQSKSSNIAAGSYNELSIISYFNNNLEKALHLAEKGIEVFVEEGDEPTTNRSFSATRRSTWNTWTAYRRPFGSSKTCGTPSRKSPASKRYSASTSFVPSCSGGPDCMRKPSAMPRKGLKSAASTDKPAVCSTCGPLWAASIST